MWRRYPAIDLAGFRRLADLERRVLYSPVAVVLVLIGVAGGLYVLWELPRGVEALPRSLMVGYGTFLVSYVALMAYYYAWRFPRLRCPQCERSMSPHVADMDEGDWRLILWAIEIGGRYYRRPHGEDDRRPWIRLMRHVRACPECRTFVECSSLHFETCSDEELSTLQQRFPAS